MQTQSPDFAKILFDAFLQTVRSFVTTPAGRLAIAIVLAVPLLKWLFHWLERRRLAAAGMDQVDRMSGLDFEKFVEVMFQRLGYRVERTPYIGDYGGDVVLSKDGVRTVVQAKRWNRKVGLKAVQEVVAAKGKYGCSEAMVVTNSSYTQQARELARANGVRLWSREDLIAARLEMRHEPAANPPAVTAHSSAAMAVSLDSPPPGAAAQAVCATCGKPVSDKVRQYCDDHPDRFAGQVLCFEHQRRAH
ncbi:MAG TPA: restriction endonuclease [Armatimonadota bacterium]|jgi:restriction system protein